MATLKFKKPSFSKPDIGKPSLHLGNLKTLVLKELQMYFNSPIAYIILIVSLILHYFIFFILSNFFAVQISDLSGYFSALPWVFMILVPTLTMGTIANEEKEGTIEFILSKPVSTLEFVLSKFISVIIFIKLLLLIELPLILVLFFFGSFDYGQIITQYLASILFAGAVASFGVFISGSIKNQTGAFLLTLLGSFLLLLIGVEAVTIRLPLAISPYLERLSLLSHFASMSKGAINLSDLLYFLGFISFFVTLTYYKVVANKFPAESSNLTKLRTFTFAFLILVFAVTAFGQRIPGRLDLTKNRVNSLTSASKTLVKNIPEKVSIEVYYSDNLPSQYQVLKRDLFSLLRDYERAAGDKVEILYKSTNNQENKEAATINGIQSLNFQEFGVESLQFSQGYLGLNIVYGELSEAIPSILNTNNLEYEISSIIKNQTVEDKKKIGILDTKVKFTSMQGVSALNQLLAREYIVEPVVFDEENRTISNELDTLIIAGANEEMSEDMRNEIRRFFNDGGSVLLLVDPFVVETQYALTINKVEHSMSNFFEDFGIKVEPSLVYDPNSSLGVRYQNYPMPVAYPPFPIVFSTGEHATVNKIENINLRWGGWISVDWDKANNIDVAELFRTSEQAGFQKEGEYNIDVEYKFPSKGESLLIALALNEKDDNAGRAIIVSDADFLSDDVIYNPQMGSIAEPSNIAFGMSAIEWLAQDESLAEIRTKNRVASPLVFPSISVNGVETVGLVPFGIQYVGTTLTIIGVVIGGIVVFWKRSKEMKKVYE